MPSTEQPTTEKTAPDWDAIERDFRAGSRAVTAIAGEHGITEGAIRKRAKRDGWVRLPKDKASTEPKAPKIRTAPSRTVLDLRHQRFVDEYLIDLNGTQAAIRAGYSANSAAEQAYDLLRKPQIKAAIEASQKRLQDKLEIKAESVVRQLALIATADPRELIEVRVGCCRCCHGSGHRSQRTELEMANDRQRWATTGKPANEFDEQGGVGYSPHLLPHPECPSCGGDGEPRTVLKDTPGFSQDARRAFAQNVFHGASYLAKLRYSDQLQDQLSEMDKHIGLRNSTAGYDSVRARQVLDEMNKRHESAMSPKSNSLSTALTSLGFIYHLGLSPASAMVNLTQTALVAYPVMAARWGYGKASAALIKASQEAVRGKNDITKALTADEKAAFDEAVRSGVIDVTMAHDLAGIAQGEDMGVMWKFRPVMKWASFLFHHAEKFNRQITFVAAYRLARDAGAEPTKAYADAVQATYDGHFDYSANNRPRVMQGNAARVLLLFKQYGQNMVYTLARSAQQSLKGASPQERAEARKTLGGLLVMHGLAAGALGLPMVSTLLAAASMLGSDDDEPWDAQVAMQNMLADAFGQKPAEVLAHGLSRLTPWDISGRVGLDRLILPDVQEGLEGQRLGESAMAAALGPVAGIGINVLKGLQDMSEGRYQRGLESMAPSALRGPLKALRYETEGVKDKSGIVVQDQVDAAAVAGQAMGFSPSTVRNAYEGKSAIVQHDRALEARRSTLVEQFAMAAMAGDDEGKADARADIAKLNEKNPGRRIQPLQLAQSVRMRTKRIEQAHEGVYLPTKRRDAIVAGRFASGG